jgi:hypothetical protein
MRNWSVDTKRLMENDEKFTVWQLEQQLNYGLAEGEVINKDILVKYLPELRIDQDTRNFLEFILYDKKPSHPTTKEIS